MILLALILYTLAAVGAAFAVKHQIRSHNQIMSSLERITSSLTNLKAVIAAEHEQVLDLVQDLRDELAKGAVDAAALEGIANDLEAAVVSVQNILPDEPAPEPEPEPAPV